MFRRSARLAHRPSVQQERSPDPFQSLRWTWNRTPLRTVGLRALPALEATLLASSLIYPGSTQIHCSHPVSGNLQLDAVRKAAVTLGVEMEMFEISGPPDFAPAFQAAAASQAAGVL